jgi:hypothetical protein
MKSQHIVLYIVLILIIIFTTILAVVQNGENPNNLSEITRPTTEQDDSSTQEETGALICEGCGAFNQIILTDMPWATFDNDAYDFTFRYPVDFDLVEERTRSTYADGTEWQYLLFKSPLRDNEARFSISINPDGIGIPYDKSFSVHETPQGKVLSVDIECTDDPNCMDDGTMLFLTRHWEEKGSVYQIILAYEELEDSDDTTNYETMLKEIVGSFRAY